MLFFLCITPLFPIFVVVSVSSTTFLMFFLLSLLTLTSTSTSVLVTFTIIVAVDLFTHDLPLLATLDGNGLPSGNTETSFTDLSLGVFPRFVAFEFAIDYLVSVSERLLVGL
jgi:hypothetical protein